MNPEAYTQPGPVAIPIDEVGVSLNTLKTCAARSRVGSTTRQRRRGTVLLQVAAEVCDEATRAKIGHCNSLNCRH